MLFRVTKDASNLQSVDSVSLGVFWVDDDSEASKDVSNWQSTQNQMFKYHFFSTYQPKMKHRLQGDKKTLASDGRKAELILALLRGDLALRGVFRHSYNETALRRATISCIYENVSCAGRH